MKRRNFIKMTSLLGLETINRFGSLNGVANARTNADVDGPLWLFIHLSGGCDFTLLCDPKGSETGLNRFFSENQIIAPGQDGNTSAFHVPPYLSDVGQGVLYGPEVFFRQYGSMIFGLNGLDYQITAHPLGTMACWSGNALKRTPSFGALLSAIKGHGLALPYLSHGGYDFTDGLVVKSNLGNFSEFAAISYPNIRNPGSIDGDSTPSKIEQMATYHPKDVLDLIFQNTRNQCAREPGSVNLRQVREKMLEFCKVSENSGALSAIFQRLLREPDVDGNLGNSLYTQGKQALVSYLLGYTKCANLLIGGFDTHNDNDEGQTVSIAKALYGVHLILQEAKKLGFVKTNQEGQITEIHNLNIVIGSDFGRTAYNAGDGKDHRSIGSMLFIGQDFPKGKLIGYTDTENRPGKLDPSSLLPAGSETTEALHLNIGHVHKALRYLAGIDKEKELSRYEINEPLLPIFER